MKEVDSFYWLLEQCQITSSQESYLRKCPFAGESEVIPDDDDSDSLSDGHNGTPVRITMVPPPASPGDGHATQDKMNFQKAPGSSLPRNPEVTLDFLAGQKSHGGRENKRMEDKTDNLRSSYTGKGTSVSVADKKRSFNMTKNGITSSSSKNPTDGISSAGGQVKPSTTQNQIFSNILGAMKMVSGDGNDGVGGSEEVNLLETAKKRGIRFPRPRWWKDIMPCDAGKLSLKGNYRTKG